MAHHELAVLAVAYLPPRWSVPALVALAAVPAAMALAGNDEVLGHYFAFDTVYYALMGLVIWPARIAARLRAGQRNWPTRP